MSINPAYNYPERVKAEIEHYTAVYNEEESLGRLAEKAPPSYIYIENKAEQLARNINQGRCFQDEIVAHIQAQSGGQILSIGSGPGGVELEIARRLKGLAYEITCFDLNPQVLALGRERAKVEELPLTFIVQDANDIVLESQQFDVIMCHASLHHLINLEHVFFEINRALKVNGKLIVVDIVTRNGYRMWEETYAIVKALWNILPPKFRYNHTAYAEVRLDDEYTNRDYGSGSMECIRSQDILPLLNEYFNCQVFVPYMSISRRFFDSMYGPNYDLSQDLDRSIVEFIWQSDVHYIVQGLLRPETMFGVYAKGPERLRPTKYAELEQESQLKSSCANR